MSETKFHTYTEPKIAVRRPSIRFMQDFEVFTPAVRMSRILWDAMPRSARARSVGQCSVCCLAWLVPRPWRWRQHVAPKVGWLYGVTFQKTGCLIRPLDQVFTL
jgi:hypothetical protein